ncbi:hypothetical protein EPUL_005095, partial [Erysiphe pulchra]
MSRENNSNSLDGNEGTIMTYEEVQEASESNIIAYMNDRTKEYDEYGLKGIELFEYWKADLENFDAAVYKKATEGTKILRDYLRENGVFIPKNRKLIEDHLIVSSKVWTLWPIESHNPQNNQLPYHKLTKPPADTSTQAAKDTLPEDGDEFKRSMLTKWNNTTHSTTIEENPDKSIEICLQLLVDDLRTIQMALLKNFRNDMSFQNKLMTACQACQACSIACSIPAKFSVALINNLRSGLSTYLAVQKHKNKLSINNPSENLINGPDKNEKTISEKQNLSKGVLFVVKLAFGTRHSIEERAKAKERYNQKFKKFADCQYDQYLVKFEGKDDSDYEYDDTEIEMLIVDIEKFETSDSETFITEVGTTDSKEAL